MRLFVTGATGFVGSHFVQRALAEGHDVVGLRRSAESRPRIQLSREPRWLDAGMDMVEPAHLEGVDVLVHLAAAGMPPRKADWDECYTVNVSQSARLVQRAISAGIPRVVASGSYAEYGAAGLRFDEIPPDAPLEPTEPYAASKACASVTLAALCRNLRFVLVYQRLFSVFGEGQFEGNFWPALRAAAESGGDFPMTKGEQIRDFVPVGNVAEAVLHACVREDVEPGRPLFENVGSGHPQRLGEFAAKWWREWDAKGSLQLGAVPYREHDVMRYVPLVPARMKAMGRSETS